jgi:hypothetical protein
MTSANDVYQPKSLDDLSSIDVGRFPQSLILHAAHGRARDQTLLCYPFNVLDPASGGALISTEARSRRGTSVSMTSLSRMAHSHFSTDPAEVSASRHPNARLSFRSRPETDRRAQLALRGDLPPSVQVQSCLQPRNGEG